MATRFLSLGLLIATDEEVAARLVRAQRERDREAVTLCRLEIASRRPIDAIAETMALQYAVNTKGM